MPNGTNEKVTDSIISLIQEKANIVNKELTEEYLGNTDKELFKNMIKKCDYCSQVREKEFNKPLVLTKKEL